MASADILRAAHSPLPWEADRTRTSGSISRVRDANGETVLLTGFALTLGSSGGEALATTEFVFRACNAHYQMLEALKLAEVGLYVAGQGKTAKIVRAAIAAAEAEADR